MMLLISKLTVTVVMTTTMTIRRAHHPRPRQVVAPLILILTLIANLIPTTKRIAGKILM